MRQWSGILAVASAAVLFGTIPVFFTFLSEARVSVWMQVGMRFGISGAIFILAVFLTSRRWPKPPSRPDMGFIFINGVLLFAAFMSYSISIALGTPAAKAILIAYVYPLLAVILARLFLSETLTRRRIFAIGLGVVGLLLTLQVWTIQELAAFRPGDVFALCSAFASAGVVVFGRWFRARRQLPALETTLWSFLFALGLMLALGAGLMLIGQTEAVAQALTFDRHNGLIPLWLVGLALFGTALPYFLMYTGLSKVPSNIAGILMLPEVVSVLTLSALFLNQPINAWQIFGGAVIIVAGMLII